MKLPAITGATIYMPNGETVTLKGEEIGASGTLPVPSPDSPFPGQILYIDQILGPHKKRRYLGLPHSLDLEERIIEEPKSIIDPRS